MINHLLNDDRMHPAEISDTFGKLIFWLLSIIIAIALGLTIAYVTPRL